MSSATENFAQNVIELLREDNDELVEGTEITTKYRQQICDFIDGFRDWDDISAEQEEQIIQLVLAATIE